MTQEQAFIKALKQAYVKALLEIGSKNREIARLERLVHELNDRLSVQPICSGEGNLPSDTPSQEAL